MILYLVEFALLHTLFFIVFKVFLSKETQLRFLRFFLIGATMLALIIPAIDIPSSAPIPTVYLDEIVFSASQAIQPVSSTTAEIPWYVLVLGCVSALFLFRVLGGLFQIAKWYRQSEPDSSYNLPIRKTSGIKNSFTFFRWIFIDLDHFDDPEEIIRHEWGHSKYLHSLDILFFHILRVLFWWVPTMWLALLELKKIHEFEADQYALKSADQQDYIKTLVHSTLKAHGLNLASSFDDAPIVKRLNFIKKMKKKISPWKVGSIMAIVIISGAMFACQEEINDEILKIAEDSNQSISHSEKAQRALAKLQMGYPGEEFSIVETKLEHKESIDDLQEYDPKTVRHVIVHEEEEGFRRIEMIVSKNSKLFEKVVELQEKNELDVFTIVEQQASYPGGLTSFYDYLRSNMKYPEEARKRGVEGRVFVQFIVEKDGSLSDLKVVKGIDPACDKEALRVVKNSPNWLPGTIKGNPVRQKMIQNIMFKISPETQQPE